MIINMVTFYISCINGLPPQEVIHHDYRPHTTITVTVLDFAKNFNMNFGLYKLFHEDPNTYN